MFCSLFLSTAPSYFDLSACTILSKRPGALGECGRFLEPQLIGWTRIRGRRLNNRTAPRRATTDVSLNIPPTDSE